MREYFDSRGHMYAVINGLNAHSIHLAIELLKLDARVLVLNSQNTVPRDQVVEDLYAKNIIKDVSHVRCGKKHLEQDEIPGGRMKDLFRVAYMTSAQANKNSIHNLTQTEDINSKLYTDFESSLEMPREHFEDCDFFINSEYKQNSSTKLLKNYLCVNSEILALEPKFFQLEQEYARKFSSNSIVIVGDDLATAELILENQDWFFQTENHLDVITSKATPFASLQGTEIFARLVEFFNNLEDYLNQQFEQYRKEVFDCREKGMKLNKSEPRETLSFFRGYSAVVMDKLYDRDEFYLTLERPEFRDEASLKTLAADSVYWLIPHSCHIIGKTCEEEGVITLIEDEEIEVEVQRTLDLMMRYFSRNE